MTNAISKFSYLCKNKPKPGDTLTSIDGKPINVIVDKRGFKFPEIYYVNCNVDKNALGWYITDLDFGLKALILPLSVAWLKDYYGDKTLKVTSLSVVRVNKKHTSLYCEILD